jgi:hypothetical protein
MKKGMFSESLDPVAGNCWRGGGRLVPTPEVAMSKPHGKTQRNGTSMAVTTMRDAVLECPQCQSTRAGIIRSDPPRAKCADCGTTYDIATLPPPGDDPPKTQKTRTAGSCKRHRKDNGPIEYQVQPVPPPRPEQLGQLTLHTETIIKDGPGALAAAHREAARLSVKFGEHFEPQWCLMTNWLRNLRASHRGRERVRYALAWRPRFLATVAMTHSVMAGARNAKVSPQTVALHRREDPDFDAQVIAAQAHCVELLHDVTMRRCIEGDLEPIYWQGIEVGHIKKFDGRLQIEMLRAHMPKVFKTPGTKVAISTGEGSQNMFICGPEEREQLIALRREALEHMTADDPTPT